MEEKEAIDIALNFCSKYDSRLIEKIISGFDEERNYWRIILDFNPHSEDDFLVIIVDVETGKAKIFQML